MVLRTYMRLSLTLSCFFFNDTATTEIYTLSLHDALPIWGGEGVECGVVRGMHGHQLTLQMRGQLGHLEPALRQDALYFVTVGLALGGLLEVEQSRVPGRDLDPFEAESSGPAGDGFQVVERWRIARELRQKYGGSFDRPHRAILRNRRGEIDA